jgi:lipooligosaccharide transport system ATP-binding protein
VEAPIVEAVGLRKRYDKHEVVCGVDFTVQARECFGLLGPNGAGKTTTIRMLTCFSPIDAGRLAVFGLPVNAANARAIKSRLGVAPQEENLDPDLTVAMNLRIYASYFGSAAPRRGRASPSCSPSRSSRTARTTASRRCPAA